MDRRLVERRRKVAEERARSNLGRLVKVLSALALIALIVWFAQSPFLSVSEIAVRGTERVDVRAVLADHGVVEDRPLLLLKVDAAERALLNDPWVASAEVARDWPTRVVVEVEERTPAALVQLQGGRWLVSGDAVLLDRAPEELPDLPAVILPDVSSDAAEESLELKGAVEYVTALPDRYRTGALVQMGEEGLEAKVADYVVRIGRPFDTAEKAVVTAAMLDAGVEEGAILTVVAPASPAVLPPGVTVPETTAPTESTTTTTP